jgi:hypothetical protein
VKQEEFRLRRASTEWLRFDRSSVCGQRYDNELRIHFRNSFLLLVRILKLIVGWRCRRKTDSKHAKRETLTCAPFMLRCGCNDWPSLKDSPRGLTAMRVCPNSKCSMHGRIVYALATRCPVCRWDLKSPLPASETSLPGMIQVSNAR